MAQAAAGRFGGSACAPVSAQTVHHCGIPNLVLCWSRDSGAVPRTPGIVAIDSSRSPALAPPPAAVAQAAADITIRPLVSLAEFKACVDLQQEVWGEEYGDAIPASLLHVVAHVGGIIAGAFAADGELVGFVFGLTGIRNGGIVHWSHALGVRESARNAGVGRMLKHYQRAELARSGVSTLYWTFDPLMAKNAHLNLNRLGARVVEYVENMYGTTSSPLHHGLATDRLIVSWSTNPDSVRPNGSSPVEAMSARTRLILTPVPHAGDAIAHLDAPDRPVALLIEVPADIQSVTSPATVAMWHAAIRANFQWALRNGYSVSGLHRDPSSGRSFYVLQLESSTPR
jgi:chorismate synthase